MVRPASPKVPLVARVSPENAPPMTPRNESSVAIFVAAGVALAGSPSVSNSTSLILSSGCSADHALSAILAPLTDGMTTDAFAPESAPMTPMLAVTPFESLSPPDLLSVVPQADTVRPREIAAAPRPSHLFRRKTFLLPCVLRTLVDSMWSQQVSRRPRPSRGRRVTRLQREGTPSREWYG